MTLALPLASFFLLAAIVYKSTTIDARHAFMLGAISWGVLLTALTEGLGALSLLTPAALALAWAVPTLILFAAFMRVRHQKPVLPLQRNRELWPVVVIAALVAVVGLIALVAPPNNWDSMTYHMSRVAHWIQNGSVSHYPTHVSRQLHQTPWAEYAILTLQILTGGDRFANLVQWFSFVGCIVGVSSIAQQLGADTRGQLAAALFSATIPMAILQASSTQNDLVVAFWLVCFVHIALRIAASELPSPWLDAIALGGSLGLAVLTKATAYLFALPFALWLGTRILLGGARRISLRQGAVAAALALAVNVGFFARNQSLYGSPLAYRYTNESHSLGALASNTVRNVGIHLGSVGRVNAIWDRAIQSFHDVFGVDLNDPRTTWTGTEFHVPRLSPHEDHTGNALHLLVIGIALMVLTARRKRWPLAFGYGVAVVAGFLLFAFILKWQPWHVRLHLPLFILSAPFAGLAIASARPHWMPAAVTAVLVVASMPWLVKNSSRPLVGARSIFLVERENLYFANRAPLLGPYREMAARVKSSACADVGLIMTLDDWEYPIFALLSKTEQPVRIEHVLVTNPSAREYQSPRFANFRPCVVVWINANAAAATVNGVAFVRTWQEGEVSFLSPARASARPM